MAKSVDRLEGCNGTDAPAVSNASSAAPLTGAGDLVADSPSLQQSTRKLSSNSLKNSWALKYHDFLPAKTASNHLASEPFQKLVERANEWLQKNEDVHVRTCETITWISHEQRWLGDGDQMILSKTIAEGTSNHFLRGLRLWLVPASSSAAAAKGTRLSRQVISCMDIVPEGKEVIGDLVEKINRKLKTRHLKGRVLTVETVGVPIVGERLQLSTTRWSESVDVDSPYAFVLRLFTDREASSRPYNSDSYVVGIRDVVPSPTESGGYESFEALIEKTNSWLKDQSDVTITNMQSLMVQRNDGPHSSIGSACFYSMPGFNSPEPTEFFRILRIAHLRLIGDRLVDIPIVYPFTYETFTPELIRLPQKDQAISTRTERLEKMKETFSKVIAFLRNTGTDLICSETVMNPLHMYIEDADTPSSTQHDDDSIRFLFTIRLFLTGQINQLGDGTIRVIKRASPQPGPPLPPPPPPPETSDLPPTSDKMMEDGARAPLFLRHVVGRQFKYRWIILAVSVFTCMAIIVVLSVVYSNP